MFFVCGCLKTQFVKVCKDLEWYATIHALQMERGEKDSKGSSIQ